MSKTEKHLRDWVQRRDVLRSAASAFQAQLDEHGYTPSHGFCWHVDLGSFDLVEEPLTKAEAVRLLTDFMLAAFALRMKPQGSA
jgi:hypothetical protein